MVHCTSLFSQKPTQGTVNDNEVIIYNYCVCFVYTGHSGTRIQSFALPLSSLKFKPSTTHDPRR
jgi:hypothetical protein